MCICFLVSLVLSGAPMVTDNIVDFAASDSTLRRVVYFVDVDYPLALDQTSTMSKFPDFSLNIDLPFSQFVTVKYNIQLDTPRQGFLITYLKVNGNEMKEFKVTSGYVAHQSNQALGDIWLEKGKHLLEVWYLTNCAYPSLKMIGWNVAVFKVEHRK